MNVPFMKVTKPDEGQFRLVDADLVFIVGYYGCMPIDEPRCAETSLFERRSCFDSDVRLTNLEACNRCIDVA